ncbi:MULTISPECIES: FumA C-terminus/TtdB family hydratase beta subunit [unclassified Archaeoglobus]|jgi:L(+)-tartrate dehydratase beta subunit|uniref:FumA C-terminus/TtdB family hydratase beta subunit n=1 Tax=unclassified Archaeoglobus TaxID=2643606 RepID=UPI0025BA7232|nr:MULTISPECIES: FumA C-terminus/TtdB family hydratase beta subunit [unclassified Archaeoglobus]
MEYTLSTPLDKETVRKLRIGDVVYLNGKIIGIRDATQRRIVDEGIEPPIDLKNHVLLHTAPNARKVEGRWEKICIGTTTSARMERYTPVLIERYGVSAVIGKGGLLESSLKAMKEFGAVYFAIVGGAAALETLQIERIEDVFWEDLFPECLWVFEVRDFGPLTVAMDSHGNSIYNKILSYAKEKAPVIVDTLVADLAEVFRKEVE